MRNQHAPGKQAEGFIDSAVRLGYLLFLPQNYGQQPDEKWPLILYLHGMGEWGDDLELVKIHGIPKIVEQRPDFPFIALSPQCPAGTMWAAHYQTLKPLLDQVVTGYAVDEKRIYLTGNSMGGYGTWGMATAHPDLFAAIAPICGGGSRIRPGPEGSAGLGLSRCRGRRHPPGSEPANGRRCP